VQEEEQGTSMPKAGSKPPSFEILNSGNTLMAARVENKEAWCDLAYVEGMPEFTVIQLLFFGDYKITDFQLRLILDAATKVVLNR